MLLMAFPACTQDYPSVPSAPESITLDTSYFEVEAAGETLTLKITAPSRPQLTDIPSWITYHDHIYQDYKMTVQLEVAPNDKAAAREAVITVLAAGVDPVTIGIRQKALEWASNPSVPPANLADWEKASVAVKNMGTGWNLGNTLESHSNSHDNMWIEAFTGRTTADYETAWGQPVATRELIHMFKEAGFNTIRVPVTWYPHMGTVTVTLSGGKGHWDMSTWTGYDVDPVWMARVKEVVDYVIDEGMYCILNVHHDTGADDTAWLRADKEVFQQVRERYVSLWTQICAAFGSYGERLIFESFNEMLDRKNTWNYSTADAHEAINMYNEAFVSTVRASGGNNAHRNLILNTYAASCLPEALSAFRLPEDSTEGHLMAEVHSYAPYHFAFDTDHPQKTFDAACEAEVKGLVENMNTYLVSKGIPCVLGEYGCTSSRSEAERSKQAACYVTAASQYNIPCLYWMSLSDGEDRTVPKWTMPAIKDAILKAYRSSNGNN